MRTFVLQSKVTEKDHVTNVIYLVTSEEGGPRSVPQGYGDEVKEGVTVEATVQGTYERKDGRGFLRTRGPLCLTNLDSGEGSS